MEGDGGGDPDFPDTRQRAVRIRRITQIYRRTPRSPGYGWVWNERLSRWIWPVRWGRRSRRSRRNRGGAAQGQGPQFGAENLQNPPAQGQGPQFGAENLQNPPAQGQGPQPGVGNLPNPVDDGGNVLPIAVMDHDFVDVIPEDDQLGPLPNLGTQALPIMPEIDRGNQLVAPDYFPEANFESFSNLVGVNVLHNNWEPRILDLPAPRPVVRPVHHAQSHFLQQFGGYRVGPPPPPLMM